MQKIFFIVSSIVLAAGIALAGFFVSDAMVLSRKPNRYVLVKGLAERIVESDNAVVQLKFNYASDDLTELHKGISESLKKLQSFLLQEGFQTGEMQTLTVSVTDRAAQLYDNNNNEKAKRYNAESGIVLETKQIEKVKQVLSKTNELVQSGVTIGAPYIQYSYNQLNEIKPTMLTQATENAKKAAETFANNSNSQLGKILWASQGVFEIESANPALGDRDSRKKVRIVTSVQYVLQ